jgi:hypothetical protein
VGHHFIAVGTKDCQGLFSSATAVTAAAATAATTTDTAAAFGYGHEEVGILFLDEIELLALGFEFRV